MTTESELRASYLSLAEARLELAGLIYRQNPHCTTGTDIASVIARSNIAMLVWSAAIDVGSSLMMQEESQIPRGYSTDITIFMTRTVGPKHPELGLPGLWDDLVQLHNVQHRADHQSARFNASCRNSHEAFATINLLLVPENRLSPTCYEWLAGVGA